MWSTVAPDDVKGPAPSARSKHSATLVGEYIYLLGGRNGNLPTRDFWKYNLVTGRWQQIKPSGDKIPCLQEHTAVSYKECIYVFGGEVGFSAGTETPLWIYDIKANIWKKKRTKKGVATPKGRRGHTALVHNGSMLIYGGYQDLRGSCSELWAYHFDTGSWHLVSTSPSKGSDQSPPPRHKHSAVLQEESMWIYGGMTDLQERSDLWKWDISSRTWHCVKSKINPGPLHSHAACKLPSSCMLVFGGERSGQTCNDLWKFRFALETWEKISITGLKPQPRSESIAITVSELLLNGSSVTSFDSKATRIRTRTCSSADRGNRHSSYLPNNKVAPCEKTYVFQPTQTNYDDGSDLAQQYADTNRSSRSFLQEIQKLSQLNIPRMSNKCSYTVLTGCAGDSTESLLKQHASPQGDVEIIDSEIATPSRGTMIKSKSAYVIKKKYQIDVSPTLDGELKEPTTRKRVEFDFSSMKMPREPVSVPNFTILSLPTPVLTPVEATKLVYLDSEEENDLLDKHTKAKEKLSTVQANNEKNLYETFQPIKKGDSYSSHIGYADNPLYQQLINSLPEKSQENVSSTSDYCSIETVNRLSSASSYSVKTGTPQDENQRINRDKNGPFGFCNPNYMGPDIKSILNDKIDKKNVVKLLTPETVKSDEEDTLELQDYDGTLGRNTRVCFKHASRVNRPPKSLDVGQNQLQSRCHGEKTRALSAGRVENRMDSIPPIRPMSGPVESSVPIYVYIIGGKEQGHVTVFKRPVSIWKLKLF
ncbi:uncharacterized protein isoform X1 [Leptinotarsa decemlineata]|uniref:uncharacterized protein isoform X1 n=1 Tax=Leptinotarsa decemlineata TaxID=7539 RepID=UPI003D304F1A